MAQVFLIPEYDAPTSDMTHVLVLLEYEDPQYCPIVTVQISGAQVDQTFSLEPPQHRKLIEVHVPNQVSAVATWNETKNDLTSENKDQPWVQQENSSTAQLSLKKGEKVGMKRFQVEQELFRVRVEQLLQQDPLPLPQLQRVQQEIRKTDWAHTGLGLALLERLARALQNSPPATLSLLNPTVLQRSPSIESLTGRYHPSPALLRPTPFSWK